MPNDFDFDEPDVGYGEEFPEFPDEEDSDVLDDIVDDADEELLSGMNKTEILAALQQEFGFEEDPDTNRTELAEQLIALREDALEEDNDLPDQPETNATVEEEDPAEDDASEDEDEEDVEVDWVEDEEDGSFVGEEDDEDLMADEDEGDEEEMTQSLKGALKSQGLEAKWFDKEEAISKMRAFDEDVTKHKEKVMLLRWKQGLVADATPVVQGESTMKALGDATGVHPNTLRNAKRLVQYFNHNVQDFKDWIREADDGIRPWYEVRDLLNEKEPQPDDSDEEKKRKRDNLKKTAEKLATTVEKLNGMMQDADEEEKREVRGLTEHCMNEIRKFQQSQFYQSAEMDGNGPIPRSRNYLDWVKEFPDPINGKPAHDPAHTKGQKGTATKSSDLSSIPLTRTHHNELDENGQDWFEDQYNVSIDRLVKNYIHRFITGQWLDMNLPTKEDL